MENKITIVLDFRFLNDEETFGHFKPAITKTEGFYHKEKEKIKRSLSVPTIEEILKVIYIKEELNFKEIEKIIKITHRAMWENIKRLEELRLVKKDKKKNEGERKEFKLSIYPKVEILQFPIYESKDEEKKKDGSKIIDSISSPNADLIKKAGLKISPIVNNKNIPKIIEEYKKKIEMRLKASNIPKRIKN
jgi:DNA-binding transcriptional regulator GbsR (MarR family)